MSIDKEKVGVLSLTSLGKDEKATFMTLLANRKDTTRFDALDYLLGDNFLSFLDAFAGESIKVPPKDDLIKYIIYSKVYIYCRNRGFSDASISAATDIFGRRKDFVMSVIKKLNRLNGIDEGDPLEDDLVE